MMYVTTANCVPKQMKGNEIEETVLLTHSLENYKEQSPYDASDINIYLCIHFNIYLFKTFMSVVIELNNGLKCKMDWLARLMV